MAFSPASLRTALGFKGRIHTSRKQRERRQQIKYSILSLVLVIVTSEINVLFGPFFVEYSYALGNAESLLSPKNGSYEKHIKYDQSKQVYNFEYGASSSSTLMHANVGTIAATISKDPSKGVVVSDSMNKVDFTMKPKFKLMEGRRDGNRVIYPLKDGSGWLVYTLQAVGVKEDLVLNFAKSNTLSLEYELDLGQGLEARMQPDGSVNVYGNKLFSSNISTGSEKDAKLLEKARKNAPKDSFLFSIPRPVINDREGTSPNVTAAYELHGTSLKVNVTGLETGNYPLTIDPSIYVVTAYQFMYGNNETNINFDVDNKMIRKGRLTGARFDSWQNTANLPIGSWGSGSVASGGYIYQVGGASFSGQVFSTQGAATYTVPSSGVSSITVKMWGGGGGGGETGGGDGGGAGYVEGTIAVSPNDQFSVYIGGGGGAGGNNAGGGGGAFTNLSKTTGGTVRMLTAGGGGGGGAQDATSDGGGGGNNGSNNGVNASGSNGGSGGTQSAGGAGGTSTCNGAAGASLAGGAGASALLSICNTNGGGGAAGTNTGAGGGAAGTTTLLGTIYGGGGGGGGYFGGGGGGASTTRGGGGGGGSSYINTGVVTSSSTSPGSGTTPGNNTDPYRGSAGNGGTPGVAGSTGLMVISTNAAGNPATKTLNWAKFDTGNGTVVNADPGNGQCSGWCSTSTYDMPAVRSNFSLVAYNGYLYAMGGNDASGPNPGTTGHKHKTIYVAKLGANGEPRLWHPENSATSSWDYWYHDDTNMTLPGSNTAGYSNAGAVAYNNKMYWIGGLDDSTSAGAAKSNVYIANILPNGKLGSWSSSTALTSGTPSGPGALFGMNALAYNDRLYIVGGNTSVGGTPIDDVYYIKINSDGTLGSSWIQTNSFTTGRLNMGGTNAAIWGGYLYIVGGCSVVNASGICTTVVGDTQIASINTDGSIGTFSTVSGLTEARMGFGMLTWRDNLYVVGGCTSQDASSGSCLGGIQAGIDYGHINLSGDVSSVAASVANGTAPCSGGTPTNCNLPGTGNVGNLRVAAVMHNGYLYVAGGCTVVGCTTTSNGVVFTTISSNGDAVRPSTCPTGSTATNGWCVMDTNMPAAVAAAGAVVFNDTLYLVGGFTGSAMAGTIKRAPLNSNGTVGTWSTDTLATIGATSVSYTFAAARANPSGLGSSIAGNLYIFGGCTNGNSGTCGTFTDAVYKCDIGTGGAVTNCSTSGQTQIGTPSEATGAGMATTGGTVYAGYIYLIGGEAPGANEMTKVRYAKFDNSNNVVDADGETAIDNTWIEDTQSMATSRRSAAAFGYNGHLYVTGGHHTGTGALGDVIFIKLNTTDGSLSTEGWKTSTTTITSRWGPAGVMAGSHIYTLGGCTLGTAPTCTTMSPTVERFQVYNNSSGGPASYTAQGTGMGVDRIGGSAAVLNGYIYYAGGCTTINCSAITNTNYYAPIGADGVIGTWATAGSPSGTTLPVSRAWGKLLAAGGTLYYVGGQTGSADTTAQNDIYYTSGISSGAPTWAGPTSKGIGDTGSGAQARTKFGATVWDNRLYIIGGNNATPTAQTTVFVSPEQASGGNITGNWTSSTAFNVARIGVAVTAYANNLYIMGGNDGTNYLSDTQYAKIDTSGTGTDGNVGTWSYATNLPGAISDADAFAANGYIYLVGGRSASSTCAPSTLFAPVTANTASDVPTGIGKWQETRTQYSGDRYGAAAVYSDGKAYVIGGGCSSFVNSSTERNYYAPLLSQPQVAKYSISFDTDTDVYPSNWLVNGYNSYSGAKWNARYRSMSDPTHAWSNGSAQVGNACSSSVMSDWGQETTQNEVVLGKINPAYTYTALDGSGNNMNCARYFFFNLTADNTLALSFPENVSATTGPSITDLTLRYTADPSKRLMHGRTFIGGLQQPVDTPYYTY